MVAKFKSLVDASNCGNRHTAPADLSVPGFIKMS
jgi:hypothetical protein